MSAAVKLAALMEAAQAPPHREDTWEEKQAWDRCNEARVKLEMLTDPNAPSCVMPQILSALEALIWARNFMAAEGHSDDERNHAGYESICAALADLDERLP